MIRTTEGENIQNDGLYEIKLVFAERQHKRTLVWQLLISTGTKLCYCYVLTILGQFFFFNQPLGFVWQQQNALKEEQAREPQMIAFKLCRS